MVVQRRKGFTLIELLVVIAIIGILSAVTLAAMSGARDQGNDKAILGNLNSLRNQAELFYSTTGNGKYYNGSAGSTGGTYPCNTDFGLNNVFADPKVGKILAAEDDIWGGTWSGNHVMCALSFNDASTYAVAVQSRESSSKWYCLDSRSNIVTMVISDDIANHMHAIAGNNASPSRCTP